MLNELNLTPELLEKAKSATSATELLALAQENGITLTTEEATTYYTQLHPKEGALADEELDNVSGGGICDEADQNPYQCPDCKSTYTRVSNTFFRCFHCSATGKLIEGKIILWY